MSQNCIMGVVRMYTVLKSLIHFFNTFLQLSEQLTVIGQKLVSSNKCIFTIDSGRE